MRIYDLKNVSKCYTFGKITSSLSNVLNRMSKSLDGDKKPLRSEEHTSELQSRI